MISIIKLPDTGRKDNHMIKKDFTVKEIIDQMDRYMIYAEGTGDYSHYIDFISAVYQFMVVGFFTEEAWNTIFNHDKELRAEHDLDYCTFCER